MKHLSFLIISAAFCFLLAACSKIEDAANANVAPHSSEFAIPLLSGTTTLRDLMGMKANDYLLIGSDGLMSLHFKSDVVSRTSKELLVWFKTVPILVKDTVTGISLKSPSTQNLNVKVIDLKTGTMTLVAKSYATQNMKVKLWIPEMTKNGLPFTINFTILYSGTTPSQGVFGESMGGYKIQPVNDSLHIHYTAMRADGTPDTVSIIGAMTNLDFSYIEGFWSKETLDFPHDTVQIDFFKNWTNGNIYFEQPSINVIAENSVGFPVRSKTNILRVFTVRNEILDVQSPFVTNGIDFAYPSLNEVGQSKNTFFSFNKNNSNITQVLGAGPIGVDFDIDAVANPDGVVPVRGFLADSSKFKIGLEVTLPFYGRAAGFAATDTFPINFDNYTKVEAAEFKVITDNSTPLTVSLQAYFIDANGTIIDSLFDAQKIILEGAPVSSTGDVGGTVTKTTFATLDAVRFANLKTAKKIIVGSLFSTSNNGTASAKALATQQVAVRMGMKLKYRQ